jgi:ribose 5-phosphate isomerase
MVEVCATKFICIVDESKLSGRGLGPAFPLPVEITPFCHEHTRRKIEGLPSLKGKTAAVAQPALQYITRHEPQGARRCFAWGARPTTSETATTSR